MGVRGQVDRLVRGQVSGLISKGRPRRVGAGNHLVIACTVRWMQCGSIQGVWEYSGRVEVFRVFRASGNVWEYSGRVGVFKEDPGGRICLA